MVALEKFRIALEFIARAGEVSSRDELADQFLNSIQLLGFEHFVCICCSPYGASQQDAVILARYPDNWRKFYLADEQGDVTAILAEIPESGLPFCWDMDVLTARHPDDADVIFESVEGAEEICGFTVPIHVVGAHPGAVYIVGFDNCFESDDQHALHLMSVYFHERAMNICREPRDELAAIDKLTPRELECLRWVSAGKTDWEISSKLNISERTVHTHIENAKRKLSVHTRLQAVAAAFLVDQCYSGWLDFNQTTKTSLISG